MLELSVLRGSSLIAFGNIVLSLICIIITDIFGCVRSPELGEGCLQFSFPFYFETFFVLVPTLRLGRPVASALDLVEVLLLHAERQAEVDALEDALLARPEDIGGLEISVDYTGPMESRERRQEVLGELD